MHYILWSLATCAAIYEHIKKVTGQGEELISFYWQSYVIVSGRVAVVTLCRVAHKGQNGDKRNVTSKRVTGRASKRHPPQPKRRLR